MNPPSNIEAEQNVIASLLLGGQQALERAQKHMEAGDCYREAHTHIFKAVENLTSRNRAVDILTLADELTRMGVYEMTGGRAYLMELADMLPTAAWVEDYAKIVREKAVRREIIENCAYLSGLAYADETDVEALSALFGKRADELNRRASGGAADGEDEEIERTTDDAMNSIINPTKGIGFGIRELDALLPLRKEELTVGAARRGDGKSGLGAQTAVYAAEHGFYSVIVTYEMSRSIFAQRMIYTQARVNSRDKLTPEIEKKLRLAKRHLDRLPLKIIEQGDGQKLTPSRLSSLVRRLSRQRPVDLLVIDYLQIVPPDKPNDHREYYQHEREGIGSVAKDLKAMTKGLHIPIFALAQLNREGAKNDRPELYHIAGSTEIENAADNVFLVHPTENRLPDMPQKYEFILPKQRNGPTGIAKTSFTPWLTRFEEHSDREFD